MLTDDIFPNIIDLVWTSLCQLCTSVNFPAHGCPLLKPQWLDSFVQQSRATRPEVLVAPSSPMPQGTGPVHNPVLHGGNGAFLMMHNVQRKPNMACSLMANKLNLCPAGFRVDRMPSGKTTAEMSCDIFNSGFLFTTVPLSC